MSCFYTGNSVYNHLAKLKPTLAHLNYRDRAVVMIGACILNGFDTKHQIIKGLRVNGLDKNHVIGLLDEQTGTVPGLHFWRRDDEGRYHLLGDA